MNPDPRVYEKAARLVHEGEEDLACNAINKAAPWRWSKEEVDFINYFRPLRNTSVAWMGPPYSPKAREHRVMALLLMAEIARDGG